MNYDLYTATNTMTRTIHTKTGDIPLFTEAEAAECFMPRRRDSHKGDYGYIALAGGSFRYSGAIRLAGMAQASVRAGAGVVQLAVPRSLCYAIRPEILESTLYPLSDRDGEMIFVPSEWDALMQRCRAIAIGMGIGDTQETRAAVCYLLEKYKGRLVIDADGLNALAHVGSQCVKQDARQDTGLYKANGSEDIIIHDNNCIDLLRRADCDIVLTPHPGEMARLCGCTVGEILEDPAGAARAFAAETGAVVLLKGPVTTVSDGEQTYAVDRGCAGMATGGSGDVLSGVMAAMLGYWDREHISLCRLAAAAAYTAGLAGELAQQESCDIAMSASDTARNVRDAVTQLRRTHDTK